MSENQAVSEGRLVEPVYIDLDEASMSSKKHPLYQLSIGNGRHGFRIFGVKYDGGSRRIRREKLDDRAIGEIRQYINAASPDPEIERLRAENGRLITWVEDLQSGMYVNCVYCGHRYGPGETTPVSMADALKEHVEQCPEHPMSALRAEVDRWAGHYADLLITGLEIESAHNKLRQSVKDYIANALIPDLASSASED